MGGELAGVVGVGAMIVGVAGTGGGEGMSGCALEGPEGAAW